MKNWQWILVPAIAAAPLRAAPAPAPTATVRARAAAVQGSFYPATEEALRTKVDTLLSRPAPIQVQGRIRALIAPHAGYRFSGAVAAAGFRQIPVDTNRVVVLAPAHRVAMRGGGSILDVASYRNALGDVELDPDAAELRRRHPFFASVPAAHEKEHSIEVMLPFLQRRLESFRLLPILLGRDFDVAAMAKALSPLLDDPRTLLVVSTDLSHYHPYEKAQELDRECLNLILALDAAALDNRELCGKAPVRVLLELMRGRAWNPTLIEYRNSGEAGSSKDKVVGYAAVAFADPEAVVHTEEAETAAPVAPKQPELLAPPEKELLLALARRSIYAGLQHHDLPPLPNYSPTLTRALGCFVTLNQNGKLRGCIGNLAAVYPLAEAVQRNALNAAFRDPRFTKLASAELKDIQIEISVLTEPNPLAFQGADDLLKQLKPGVHGVTISQGERRATYLPQVWSQIPNKQLFLAQLCRKAGLAADAWKTSDTLRVEVYEAFVFAEEPQPETPLPNDR